MHSLLLSSAGVLGLLAGSMFAQSPASTVVVPADAEHTDAPSLGRLPGVGAGYRMQILIGPSHLATVPPGAELAALEFRRNPADRIYSGGSVLLRATVATFPGRGTAAGVDLEQNLGADRTVVHDGALVIPTSPAAPGPAVTWAPENTVRIPFTTPFRYTGGTLCIDLDGRVDPAAPVRWWPIDFATDPAGAKGQTQTFGVSCSDWGRTHGITQSLAPAALVPGNSVSVLAWGTPGESTVMLVGTDVRSSPQNLDRLLGSQGCELWLAEIATAVPAVLADGLGRGGAAGASTEIRVHIPPDRGLLDSQFATQWLELGVKPRLSQAIACRLASSLSTLELATVTDMEAGAATRRFAPRIKTTSAPVLRLEYR